MVYANSYLMKRAFWFCFFVMAVTFILPSMAEAQNPLPPVPPSLPASFYGSVAVEQGGTVITAVIDNNVVAKSAIVQRGEESVYTIKIAGDNPATEAIEGGRAGDVIVWQIDGQVVTETAVWQSGIHTHLNLTMPNEVLNLSTAPTAFSWHWFMFSVVFILLIGTCLWLKPQRKTAVFPEQYSKGQ